MLNFFDCDAFSSFTEKNAPPQAGLLKYKTQCDRFARCNHIQVYVLRAS